MESQSCSFLHAHLSGASSDRCSQCGTLSLSRPCSSW
ncbi:MAG: hypothetical protein E6G57_12000 [Actinobacteria bacterium]|nr:MAG: hypothetical protein E6G57_12000 [Actinomycetota bacterium]